MTSDLVRRGFRTLVVVAVLSVSGLTARVVGVETPIISLDPASPTLSTSGKKPSDLLRLPPLSTYLNGSSVGLQGTFPTGPYDNLNSVSFGETVIPNIIWFSVDRLTQGRVNTSVALQAATGNAAGSIFNYNTTQSSQSLRMSPQGIGLTGGFFGDDLDGLNPFRDGPQNYFFTLDATSATVLIPNGPKSSDVLFSTGNSQYAVFANGVNHMGLSATDIIDALILIDLGTPGVLDPGEDYALISFDPFSPATFTATGLTYDSLIYGQLSPADIFITHFDGVLARWSTAEAIGLRSTDNLNALSVPEANVAAYWLGLLLTSAGVRVRRTKQFHLDSNCTGVNR